MNSDWKDILAAVNVPAGHPEPSEQPAEPSSTKKAVTLFYEAKGRNGKPVTILADFKGVDDNEIVRLASDLKRRLGTGGSCRGGEILIQGDRRQQLRSLLVEREYKVKG